MQPNDSSLLCPLGEWGFDDSNEIFRPAPANRSNLAQNAATMLLLPATIVPALLHPHTNRENSLLLLPPQKLGCRDADCVSPCNQNKYETRGATLRTYAPLATYPALLATYPSLIRLFFAVDGWFERRKPLGFLVYRLGHSVCNQRFFATGSLARAFCSGIPLLSASCLGLNLTRPCG